MASDASTTLPAIRGKPIEKAFEGDCLNRAQLAERLEHFVERLKEGHTIAIDADWGSGKTWFGQHFEKYLKTRGFTTIWVDTFARDYSEDPFLPLLEPLIKLEGAAAGRSEIADKAIAVGKRLAPAVLKAIAKVSLSIAVGGATTEQIGDAIAGAIDSPLDNAEAWMRQRLSDLGDEEEELKQFKVTLKKLAAEKSSDKPIVYFIDELDRCRPDYAVKLIERLKHLFEIDGIVFVLLINRTQLEAAVKGLYGESFDAERYLEKFFHLFLTLPPQVPAPDGQNRHFRNFTWNTAKRLGIDVDKDKEFLDFLASLAAPMGISLRSAEKIIRLRALTPSDPRLVESGALSAWLMALKVCQPEVFLRLRKNERAFDKIMDILRSMVHIRNIQQIMDLTNLREAPDLMISQERRQALINQFGGRYRTAIDEIITKIDLSVD